MSCTSLVLSEFCVELMDRSAADLHDMFTRTYGQLYEQNAHIFTSLFVDLRAYYFGTDLDLGTAIDSFFSTLMLRMFRLLNAQYAFDDDYLECVGKNVDNLTPFGDVPQKLGVQLKRALVAARTFYQGLVVGHQVVDALLTVSHSSLITTSTTTAAAAAAAVPLVCLFACSSRLLQIALRDFHWSVFCDPTQPDQLTVMAKVEFSKCSFNILRVVKFILIDVKSCKHDVHEKYA